MPRHPTARRIHRPAPASDDVFVERVLETTVWAKTHQLPLIITAVAVVAIVGLGLFYRNYRTQLRTEAATQLTQIRQTVLSGNQALASRDLEQYLETFGGTPSAPEARLMLAQSYLLDGQAPKAIEVLENQAGDLRHPMGTAAAFLLADAYENASQLDRAETVLLRIASGAPFDFEKERAWDGVARLRLERGDAAGAVQAYDRLLEVLASNNPDRSVYEMRRAEAQARMSGAS
jgi:predicted negative regulator of RcsB-dependent stress response